MYNDYHNGQTSVILRPKLRNATTGQGFTGVTSATSGLIISTIADNEATPTVYSVAAGTIESIATLGIYAAPTATKCRLKLVHDTNHPGDVEIQLADARFGVTGAKSLKVTISGVSGMAECDVLVPLKAIDSYAADGGLTLPDAPSDWLTAASVKADAVTKIQSGLATPTNITAGTIGSVTDPVTIDLTPIIPTDGAPNSLAAIFNAIWVFTFGRGVMTDSTWTLYNYDGTVAFVFDITKDDNGKITARTPAA